MGKKDRQRGSEGQEKEEESSTQSARPALQLHLLPPSTHDKACYARFMAEDLVCRAGGWTPSEGNLHLRQADMDQCHEHTSNTSPEEQPVRGVEAL